MMLRMSGKKIRQASERIFAEEMARTSDKEFQKKELFDKFLTKENMTLELLLFQSVLGPIGLPAVEAVYPGVATSDGKPMNAKNDYVVRMTKGELPPADAFWSVTMYDGKTQLLIKNPLDRYLLNSAMMDEFKTEQDGSLVLHIGKDSPGKDLEANWLPAPDGPFYMIMRLYWPKPEALDGTWQAPPVQPRRE